ncbi:Lysophospholipid acyltransferase LPEAT1 [Galdieria sulphuraria]|nr:Lysophospholipid acyltransferase LPEAT1 [Galdieria sulphuraria]
MYYTDDSIVQNHSEHTKSKLLVRNPFVRRDRPWRLLGLIKVLVGLVLVPLRLLFCFLLLVFVWILIRILALGVSRKDLAYHPLVGFRRACISFLIRRGARLLLLIVGFVWISDESRTVVPPDCIVVSNHVSFYDILYFLSAFAPPFVAKQGVKNIPFVGFIAEIMECIFVDRENRTSPSATSLIALRLERIDLLNISFSSWMAPSALVMFPEGTTSNGDCLLRFHTGPFVQKRTIQPIVLQYSFGDADPAFVGLSFFHFLRILSEPYYILRVNFLPRYVPSEEEKTNGRLFAENVRRRMATILNRAPVDLSYQDRIRRKLSRCGLEFVSLHPDTRF